MPSESQKGETRFGGGIPVVDNPVASIPVAFSHFEEAFACRMFSAGLKTAGLGLKEKEKRK